MLSQKDLMNIFPSKKPKVQSILTKVMLITLSLLNSIGIFAQKNEWDNVSDSAKYLKGVFSGEMELRDLRGGEIARYFVMEFKFHGNQVQGTIDNQFVVDTKMYESWGESKGSSSVSFNHSNNNIPVQNRLVNRKAYDILFTIGPYTFFGELKQKTIGDMSWGEIATSKPENGLSGPVQTIEGFFEKKNKDGNRVFLASFTVDRSQGTASTMSSSDKKLITIERNPLIDKRYKGIVTGYGKFLALNIKQSEKDVDYILIEKPNVGSIRGKSIEESPNGDFRIKFPFQSSTVKYAPPDYLKEKDINYYSEKPKAGCCKVPLFIEEHYQDGKTESYTIDVFVHRPPVILVHGFTGDSATWKNLDQYLQLRNFNTHRGEYYSGNESIPAQSIRLNKNIESKKNEYREAGLKTDQIDVVAHSMGGLISRYYTTEIDGFDNDIRKIIMVATPNHGVSWVDYQIGAITSKLSHVHEIAAGQLYHQSKVIRSLNMNENRGGHLNPEVEYANIYSYSPEFGFFEGDMVVPVASAHLNGVPFYLIRGNSHSSALEFRAPAITKNKEVFDKVHQWLSEPISRKTLDGLKMKAMIKGDFVYEKRNGENVRKNSLEKMTTFTLRRWDRINLLQGHGIIQVGLDDKTVARILLFDQADITIGFVSPQQIQSKLVRGKARFTAIDGVIHHSVDIPRDNNYRHITALNTDFTVESEQNIKVNILEGKVLIKAAQNGTKMLDQELNQGRSISIDEAGNSKDYPLTEDKWWEKNPFSTKDKANKEKIQSEKDKKTEEIVIPGTEKEEVTKEDLYWIFGFVAFLIFLIVKGHFVKKKRKKKLEEDKKQKMKEKEAIKRNKAYRVQKVKSTTNPEELYSYCPTCKSRVRLDLDFCQNCNTKIIHEEHNYKYCTNCGNQNDSEDNYCSKCGSRLKN